MLEVEIKAKIEDASAIEEALKREGFRFLRKVTERDTYFQGADRDFGVTDEALRLRHRQGGKSDEYILTYKGPKKGGSAKSREEHEAGIAEPEGIANILAALGHVPAHTVVKHRAYYIKGDITACVDEVEGAGLYLELEQMNGLGEGLIELKEKLGAGECTDKSYLYLVTGH